MPIVNVNSPACSQCKRPLKKTEAFFAGQDTHYAGSVCFSCIKVFCVNCLQGTVDRCPSCQSEAKTAYRNTLNELNSVAPKAYSRPVGKRWWKFWSHAGGTAG